MHSGDFMAIRSRNHFNRSRLTLALAAALVLPTSAIAQDSGQTGAAQQSTTGATRTLDKVQVTGSRIKKVDVEGAAPITVITEEDIKATGLNTIQEVLSTLTVNTGDVDNEMTSGGWTPNGAFINLRGLGPGYTLVLVNGRRMADYPQAYGGNSNAVSTSSIPAGAVSRIEVLSGGASAIYGSDAVAGVINIITKENYEGDEVRLKIGTTTRGGGNSGQVQWTGGRSGNNWSATYGAEYFKRDPILGNQRSFMDSYYDNPAFEGREDFVNNPASGVRVYRYAATSGRPGLPGVPLTTNYWLDENGNLVPQGTYAGNVPATGAGLAALQNTCSQWDEFEPYNDSAVRPNSQPNNCGYFGQPATQTIQNEYDRISAFASATYTLDNDVQLYGQFLGTQLDATTAIGTRFLQPQGGYVENKTMGMAFFSRYLTPTEIGSPQITEHNEKSFNIAGGVRGTLWNEKFDWDLGLAHSKFKYESSRPWLLTGPFYDYFFGGQYTAPPAGTYCPTNPCVSYVPAFDESDLKRWLTPITPDIYESISSRMRNTGDSSSSQINFTVSGDLFDLPAGPLGAAFVVEAGRQEFAQIPDERTTASYTGYDKAMGLTGARSQGERSRYAAGLELSVPIFSQLKASLAGRWDRVDDMAENALTWSAGLEYRPFSNLLLRGNYATSYRAPDMTYVFTDETGGFYSGLKDYYQCRVDGKVPTAGTGGGCTGVDYSYQIFGIRNGSRNLSAEEGRSFTAGLVWDITDNMSLTTDYYRIELEGKVSFLDATYLLRSEADCRLGQTETGETVDPNSSACQDFLAFVQRTPDMERITGFDILPYNQALAESSGVDTSWTWRLGGGWMGDWILKASHTAVLKLEDQAYPGTAVRDLRDHRQFFNFRSRASWGVTWLKDSWSTTLSGYRLGSLPNWAETGRIAPFMLWNLSVNKKFNDKFRAGVQVVNVFNATHPQDDSYDTYPYFWRSYQAGAIGPQVYLDLTYKF